MDETEHFLLNSVPMKSVSLRLARSTIKMNHDTNWHVDKLNPVHDLVVCLSGAGMYRLGDDPQRFTLKPGDAMLIPAYTRFRGSNGSDTPFIGIAQHFSVELFGRGDMISQLNLKPRMSLPNWSVLGPLTQCYHDTTPHGATTLMQHHQFMVILLGYLEAAFLGWKNVADSHDGHDQLSIQIMKTAARLSSDPLGNMAEEAMADVPYNPDYFRRAFKERIGYTPQKFRELKRMEFAANRLGMGCSVKAIAADLGFADPYFFSRLFKRYLGASPTTYRAKPVHRS